VAQGGATRLVLATANPHKAVEIAALLEGFEVVPRPGGLGDVDETDDTLEGNARLKARAVVAATAAVRNRAARSATPSSSASSLATLSA
jgi:inosine/xanthosine triphosphate pyrophosphatase family protein